MSRQGNLVHVGLDVHAATIAVAVCDSEGCRSVGTVPNEKGALRRILGRLGRSGTLRVCYEAGPTGYVVYWWLVEMGIACEVVAPSLVPVRAGDRVKTDRRDALKLARSYRSGDLTAVWVPDAAQEALRDLVRARESAKRDHLRARHRLGKFLLRRGLRWSGGKTSWTQGHLKWIRGIHFEEAALEATLSDYLHEVDHATARIERLEKQIDAAIERAPAELRELVGALQCLRGVRLVAAVTIASEVGRVSRFGRASQLMSYGGLVPSEYSSGSRTRRGAITKTGNAHLRRILVEAAWSYRYWPSTGRSLQQRQKDQPAEIVALAWEAQRRLCGRYRQLLGRGKPQPQVVTAVARELLGFIWSIGKAVEERQAA